ncbi:helix-turn-helix domain-containing protein [Desmospora activa]|uniref:helix-turn-helix domain-containing protein n=1 Tax=Desmospora activa TaxID=500615 RepID=UPI00147489C0|nr:helix-turn-helix domain-containing protein [Desmospora activa]
MEDRDPNQPHSRWTQIYKALADEKRLRILRAIQQGVDTLPALSADIGMPKTTLHHHLTLLRSARLVTMEGSRYRFDQYTWSVCREELEQYLGIESDDVS